MKNQDFTCSITADVTADEAMFAISQIQDWWKKDFVGTAEKLNDEFTVRFSDESFVNFTITEFVPNAKVVWTVTDCFLPWFADKTEWTGTRIIFGLATTGDSTTINFTHQGLAPQVECYDMCAAGWTGHITTSLQKLLAEGMGQPA